MTTPKLRPEIGGQALSRRQLADKQAAKRLLRKLLKKQMQTPRFMITDKLRQLRCGKEGGHARD